MKAWCSGRGGLPAGGGRGFDSLRPRCRDLTRKIVEMGAGAGQWGPPPIKKNFYFFGKNSYFFGFLSVPTLPSVGHSAKALPSAR